MLYLLLLAFPQPLFAYSYEHAGINIYSKDPIPENTQDILTSIRSRIKESTLYHENDTFHVFLCNNKNLYTLLTPVHNRGFAVSYPVLNNIIVAYGDLDQDLCRAYKQHHNKRSLKSVVSHEIGHELMYRHLGFWKDRRLPQWLKEGYCEVIAGDSSFPVEKGRQLMITGQSDPSWSFRYYTYRQMVDYLINERKQSINQLAAAPPNEKVVMKKTVDWLSMKRIEPVN